VIGQRNSGHWLQARRRAISAIELDRKERPT